ncbi:Signal peptidase I [Ligilactobacillus equi DSM 15833 = JCM 10991]|uniref:Signal peptidase I n=2 Tax=Ligilactobacillus equi TaxID=137357 RepID=A0A0R1TTW3_9LACO|nr:Signal peptidase I [Ligilactobacillus equi DSM 15833 = JCM 10991]MCQ2557386.1 signal peptidase I [Ligilactobacillus sp.]
MKSLHSKGEKLMKKSLEYLIPVVVGLAIALIIRTFLFSLVSVSGNSMDPNLYNREKVVLVRQGQLKRGKVIVFKAHGVDKGATLKTLYVKRVIGLPGDVISYHNDGSLFVNGKKQSQSYISRAQQKVGTFHLVKPEAKDVSLGTGRKFRVPKNKYFVLGDNRQVSNDSRYYGYVPRDKILGTVWVFWWHEKQKLINDYQP